MVIIVVWGADSFSLSVFVGDIFGDMLVLILDAGKIVKFVVFVL